MTTPAQAAANRANAQKSTGPKTPAGKARAALNALDHGFRSQIVLARASGPDAVAYAAYLESLVALLQPVGPLESQCVETMALADWRKRLVIQKEFDLQEEPDPSAPVFIDRTMFDIPRDPAAHFPPFAPAPPAPNPPVPKVILPCPEKLLPLLRYEAHLTREHRTAYRQLCALQALRLAQESPSQPPTDSPAPAPSSAPPSNPSSTHTELPNEPNPLPPSALSSQSPEGDFVPVARSFNCRATGLPASQPKANEAGAWATLSNTDILLVTVPALPVLLVPFVPNEPNLLLPAQRICAICVIPCDRSQSIPPRSQGLGCGQPYPKSPLPPRLTPSHWGAIMPLPGCAVFERAFSPIPAPFQLDRGGFSFSAL